MRKKLEVLKKVVEERSGCSLTTNTRKREFTHARSVYCKLARRINNGGHQFPYSAIGELINKDHATVMHNINVIFPFAMKEEKYRNLYQELSSSIDEDFSDEQIEIHSQGIQNLYQEIYKRDSVITELRSRNYVSSKLSSLLHDLDSEELDHVFEKISITVKVVKNQRGAYSKKY